jgi:predicted dehydrogenase
MSRVNLGLYQSDVSVIWDLGPHDFSILLYWLEERPTRVISTGRACIDSGKEDVAFITCEFDSGTIAHVELSWLAPSKLRRTTVVGSQKMVVYDDCSNEPVRVYDAGVVPRDPESFGEFLKYRTGDIVSPHIESAEPMALQIDDFCRAIRSGTTPRSSARLGLDVVRMIEAATRPPMYVREPCFVGRSGSVADM